MDHSLTQIAEMDRGSVLHPFTHAKDYASGKAGDPTIITGGKGIRIQDAKGNSYIDGFAGLYCVNIGYGRDEVADAISKQAHQLAYYHSYAAHTTDQLAILSDRLVRMAPGKMSKVFYGMSGSDANETQAKLVWYYNNLRGMPAKKKIISRDRGYHGCSVISGSMTGMSFYHDHMDLPMGLIRHTGALFGCTKYDIEPDLITVAKGLTSAYVPLSAAIIGEKVYKVIEEGADRVGAFSHGYTYSGHPIGVACANAVLDIVEREDLPGNARTTGAYFQDRLRQVFAQMPIVGEVRGVGLMAALEFVADRDKKQRFDPALKVGAKVSAAARARGLIARAMPHGDILGFAPPLVTTREDVDAIIDIAEAAVREVMDQLTREKAFV